MADLISTDHPLSTAQQRTLAAVLDTLLPASADGRLPSAAEVNFDAYLLAQAPDALPALEAMLGQLGEAFVEHTPEARVEQMTAFSNAEPEAFQNLLTRVYDCYYQNDQVRSAIGMKTGAPFPQGNEVVSGDLSLLDPVIGDESRHRYREP